MKKIFILLTFLFPLIVSAQDEQFIEWSGDKRLSWEDYLGSPAENSDAAAITSTALGMEYHVRNNVLTYKISCRFSRIRSWGKYKSNYILQHEQGHFDITEIFARKLAKELYEYKFNPRRYKDDLNKIYKKVMTEKEEFQNAYDEGTNFSRDKRGQAQWLERIELALQSLNDYAGYSTAATIQASIRPKDAGYSKNLK